MLYNFKEDNTAAYEVYKRGKAEFLIIIEQKATDASIARLGFKRTLALIEKIEAVGN